MRSLSERLLLPIYAIGIIGALLQISGGYWDVSWHLLGLVETFFTQPHMILYTGIVLTLSASIVGLVIRVKGSFLVNHQQKGSLLAGLQISLIGGVLQAFAGGFDSWWHSNFGFDPFLFTPSHALLIIGIMLNGLGMTVGSIRFLQAHRARLDLQSYLASSRWLELLVIIALTALWLDINTLVYLVTDVNGIAYTFQLSNAFVERTSSIAFQVAVLALTVSGTLIFYTTKRTIVWKGGTTAVALISVVISTTTNLTFRALVLEGKEQGSMIASFIPLYISFIIPVLIFDLVVGFENQGRLKAILASALIGPFASYLDGWFSLILWMQSSFLLPILFAPMLILGVISRSLGDRFTRRLSSHELVSVAQSL